MTQKPERLPDCPLLACTPQARSQNVCYGRNGVHRACMLVEGEPVLQWTGEGAWSGPADVLEKEAKALKENPA